MIAQPDQVAWFRLRRSGLVDRFDSPEEASRSLGGIQAQVLRSAGLALSARLRSPFTSTHVADALYGQRKLVKIWSHRRTLHLHTLDDWPVVFALNQGRPTWAQAAIKKVGGDPEALQAGAHEIVDVLEDGGTLSKQLLLEHRPEFKPFLDLGIGFFMDVQQTGPVCHAQPVGSHSHFTHRAHWVPDLEWNPPSRDQAGIAITRRYLRAYGPVTPQDVAFWLGGSVRDARRWLDELTDQTVAVEVEGTELRIHADAVQDLSDTPPPRTKWPVRLLHRYDVLLLAHKDKSWLIDAKHYKRVWKTAGVVDAVVLDRGRIVGTWGYKLKTRSVEVTVTPFGRLSARAKRGISVEAERVAHHLEVKLGALQYEA